MINFNVSSQETTWKWSEGLNLNSIGVQSFQLRKEQNEAERDFYSCDIREQKGTLFAIFQNLKQHQIPYCLVNNCKMANIFAKQIPILLDDQTKSHCYFCWDDPLIQNQQLQLQLISKQTNFSPLDTQSEIDNIIDAKFFVLKNKQTKMSQVIKMSIRIQDFQKIITFEDSSQQEINDFKQLKKQITFSNDQNQMQQGQEDQKTIDLKVILKFENFSLTFIDNQTKKPIELLLITLSNTEAVYISNQMENVIFQIKIQSIQFDNTTKLFPHFPVILSPIRNQRQQELASLNFLIQYDTKAKHIDIIDKIVLELCPLTIKLDDSLINQYLALGNKIKVFLDNINQELNVIEQENSQQETWQNCKLPDRQVPQYIKEIAIMALQLQITLSLNKSSNQQDNIMGFLKAFSGAVGVTLGNIDNATFKFTGIRLENCFDSFDGLLSKIIYRYQKEAIQQFYIVLGSLNIIGNPLGLFNNVSTGVMDLIERPIDGLTKGPIEAGMGLVSGAGSLVGHTIAGTCNSFQTFVGSVSSGLSYLTLDDEYLLNREKMRQAKSRNLIDGVKDGTISIFQGFFEGGKGVLMKPYENIKNEGTSGILKGTWQGLTGLLIKPIAGVLDATSKTTEGLKNQFFSSNEIEIRKRPLRAFYHKEKFYKNYDYGDGYGIEILQGINKGKLENNKFHKAYVFEWKKKTYILIVALENLILADMNDKKELWIISTDDIVNVRKTNNQIEIETTKSNQQKQKVGIVNLEKLEMANNIYEDVLKLKEKQKL